MKVPSFFQLVSLLMLVASAEALEISQSCSVSKGVTSEGLLAIRDSGYPVLADNLYEANNTGTVLDISKCSIAVNGDEIKVVVARDPNTESVSCAASYNGTECGGCSGCPGELTESSPFNYDCSNVKPTCVSPDDVCNSGGAMAFDGCFENDDSSASAPAPSPSSGSAAAGAKLSVGGLLALAVAICTFGWA